MGAFEQEFSCVVVFDIGGTAFVVSREQYSREEAVELLQDGTREYYDDPDLVVDPEQVVPDRVRFCIQHDPETSENQSAWWLGARGRGSKPVWVYG